MLFDKFTDVVPSIWGTLNQGPLTLTIVLHTLIVLPMLFLYFKEKKRLERGE